MNQKSYKIILSYSFPWILIQGGWTRLPSICIIFHFSPAFHQSLVCLNIECWQRFIAVITPMSNIDTYFVSWISKDSRNHRSFMCSGIWVSQMSPNPSFSWMSWCILNTFRPRILFFPIFFHTIVEANGATSLPDELLLVSHWLECKC